MLHLVLLLSTFGAPIDAKAPVTPLPQLVAEGKVDTQVVTTGEVKTVCQEKGCWMAVEAKGTGVRVMFANYGFFVPKDVKGKTATLSGKLVKKELSAAESQHFLADEGKSPAEVAKVKGSTVVYQFVADGVAFN